MFYFSQILDDLDENHKSIYTNLEYVGLGILYFRIGQLKEADFYFAKVLKYMEQRKDQNFDKGSINAYLRILTLIFFTAEFYSEMGNYPVSDEYVSRGIKLCSEQHITYYLPRLKFLAAKTAIGKKQPKNVVDELLTESSAFAKINHNEVVQLRINALRKQYDDGAFDNK